MSLFDLLIVQPIFNVLVLIYGLLPGADFGIAVILFTVLTRLLMWPLVKKQLHQTKVIRKIQPELKKIKTRSKGNKQLEAQLMMELYREKGVSPFSSIGLLIVQLPIFIALYQVINIMTVQRDRIAAFTYSPLEGFTSVKNILTNPDTFNETLLGIINLAQRAVSNEGVYIPLVILAAIAAGLQFFQARQTMPQTGDQKRLRDILQQQAKGDQIDQSEVTAVISKKMITILPIVTFLVGLYLPGALVLYFAASSLVAVIQQRIILGQDIEEMETAAGQQAASKSGQRLSPEARAQKAVRAQIVQQSVEPESQPLVTEPVVIPPVKKKVAKKKRKRR